MSKIFDAFLANEASIRRYLARFQLTAQELEDALQETFLRGFAAETRNTIKEPKAYLFQIAKHVALDFRKKRTKKPTDSLEDFGGADLILDERQTAVDDWLEGRRKLVILAKAVAQLPQQCRKAFLMRRVEGLAYKQIANRMNISVSAVEKHVATGLLKFYVSRATRTLMRLW